MRVPGGSQSDPARGEWDLSAVHLSKRGEFDVDLGEAEVQVQHIMLIFLFVC